MFDEAGEDEILLAAVMRLGAAGGAVGGGLAGTGVGATAGARGGARGAARGFKRMKKDLAEQQVQLSVDDAQARDVVRRAFETSGQLVGSEERPDGSVAFRALIGVGMAGLNPVVVTAVVGGESADAVTVDLRAVGREGLIKQHPADKALAKIAGLLSSVTR